MKKNICILLFCFLFLLCACKPSDMRQDIYDIGKDALTVTDSYINGKASAKITEPLLDGLYDALQKYDDTSTSELILSLKLSALAHEISMAAIDEQAAELMDAANTLFDGLGATATLEPLEQSSDFTKIKEARDALAKTIGK